MAKLSAHGTEVARYERRQPSTGGAAGVVERVSRFSFRSDGALLEEYLVRFEATPINKERLHSYGWKLYKRKLTTPEQVAQVNRLTAAGYALVSG
jgi:hypothetical protein